MKRFLLAALGALMLVPAALGAGPTQGYAEEGGGGSSTPNSYIISVYTYINGYPQYLHCRYLDFGNGLVIQASCWT